MLSQKLQFNMPTDPLVKPHIDNIDKRYHHEYVHDF